MHRLKQLKNQYFQDSHQRDKQLFFLVAMPRSGNTLFASIMNQNPDIACTANSITLEIMKDLFLLKNLLKHVKKCGFVLCMKTKWYGWIYIH